MKPFAVLASFFVAAQGKAQVPVFAQGTPIVAGVTNAHVNEGTASGPIAPVTADGFVATERGLRPIALEGFSEDVDMDGFVDPIGAAVAAPVALPQPAFVQAAPQPAFVSAAPQVAVAQPVPAALPAAQVLPQQQFIVDPAFYQQQFTTSALLHAAPVAHVPAPAPVAVAPAPVVEPVAAPVVETVVEHVAPVAHVEHVEHVAHPVAHKSYGYAKNYGYAHRYAHGYSKPAHYYNHDNKGYAYSKPAYYGHHYGKYNKYAHHGYARNYGYAKHYGYNRYNRYNGYRKY